ncbi:tyrosine-protein phosphatase [Streptomyces sp. NBC_01003]|uniref:tyrosine-protein phosphatase n=1 Tax=Streptomyces sp. NBC_01003 TaxID=2903714 RepID=UPI0038703017|nr:tyrosine-protein phosphatase [Streptomyces sp. NBC_01003]
MTQMTRVRASSYALVAALLVGLSAPVAAAHPASHDGHTAHHRIPFTAATVMASEDGSSFTVEWKAPGVRHVAVRAGGRTVASGGSTGKVTVRGLPAADRQWFDLVPDRGQGLHLADREIRLDGGVNFRDAGGYRTTDGHWVRMGEIYRTASLDKLSDRDLAKLKRLGISVDYDLRTQQERTSAPDRVPAGSRYVVADVLGDLGGLSGLPASPEAAAQLMVDAEKTMVSAPTAQKAYTTVLQGIADADGANTLFHCTAGKDRTGWANATLLTALGVPRETVTADYLASNTYRAKENAAMLAAMPPAQAAVYKPLLDVRPEYLNSGFQEVTSRYGTFDHYLDKSLGLSHRDVRDLREDLLVG